eukprot:403353278
MKSINLAFLTFSLIVRFCQSQTPTALWKFDSPTSATYTNNIYNGGNPSFYIDQNGLGEGINSRFVGNGMYFEGDELACTHAPAGTTLKNDQDFSVDLWAYVNILNSQSQLVCKFYNNGGLIIINNIISSENLIESFCIGYNNEGELEVRINKYSHSSGNTVQTLDTRGCQLAEGWNHITVTFDYGCTIGFFGICSTGIVCHVQTDTGLVTTDSITFGDIIIDDSSNEGYLCAGGTISTGFLGSSFGDGYTGMINQISFYAGTSLTSAQALAQYSTNCQGYCKICKPVGTAPYQCLQQQAKYFAKYDFSLSTYPVTQIHSDTSGKSFNLAVNSNFGFTPAYAHNQGLWFDTTFGGVNQYINSVGSTKIGVPENSFTLEAWIRPTVTPTSAMNLFEKESSAGTNYFKWGFNGATAMTVTLTGQTATYNTGAITVGQWHFVAVSIVSTTVSTSQICFKIDSVAQSCTNVNSVLIETGTSITQIGDGFRGFIKDMYVYDYAKEEQDMTKMVQTTGCTNNVNGNTCTRCPYITGQCISDCNANEYVNSTTTGCTSCYASCRTCWGAYYNNCYSCVKTTPGTWVFDYVKICSSTCGDSIRDDYEKCDDGNTANGDGCSSTCLVETGFTCNGGSFSTKDTCTSKCGDGVVVSGKCDDGNTVRGNGCDAQCNIETGYTCTGAPSVCSPTCGDSRRVGTEGCDDGNTVNNDGCSSTCAIETGFNCTNGGTNTKDTCQEICGDGKDYAKYQCDDGNTVNFDGCDQNCRTEIGFTCTGGTQTQADTCTETCGDGRNFKLVANQCDDGNTKSGDGCSSTCLIETGFACQGGSRYTKDVCYEICGDGKNMGSKQCDDGNLADGDGCHSDCTIEIGYSCTGGTSTLADTCTEICGDGRNFGTYQCDDGNSKDGDGCSSTCSVETGYLCSDGDGYTASVCTKFCDGIRDFYNMCDDGNTVNGDGCDYCCNREIGFSCAGGSLTTADTCSETCGDGRKMNYLECDDANNISGDGCSSSCVVESGYTCTGGTLFTPDTCKEICGDGINLGNYECDDGNVKANDGCSSLCYIEDGFTCTSGNSTTASKCTETCGDGKNMKTYLFECDDGNTNSGDGCSSKCLVETGFECNQGGFYTYDICNEICGDGLDYENYECDDGNSQDGDGCSSYCSIDSGWTCLGGTKNSPDSCYPLSNPAITSAYFNSDNTQIILNFNETVLMTSKWSTSSSIWLIEMRGPLGTGNYEFTWNVSRQASYKNPLFKGTQEIIIDFSCKQQLFGNKIDRVLINFVDKNYIRSFAQQTPMINTSAIVYPYGQDDFTEAGSTHGFPKAVDTLTYSLIIASYGVGFIGSMFGNSMMDVWIMMNGLQQIYIFPTNNLYIPTATTNYIKHLQYSFPQSDIIGYLCFGGATNHTEFQDTNPTSSYTYYKMGFQSTAFLQTSADVLSLFVYFFIFSIVIEIIREAFEENKSLNNSLERVKSSMIVGYLNFAFTKLAFTSHLNLKHLNFDEPQNSLSSLLAMSVGVGCWVYMLYNGYQAYKFYREMKVLRQSHPQISDQERRDLSYFRGNVLFQEYSTDGYTYPLTIFYPIVVQFKILLTCCLIISDATKTQLQGIMLINLMSITTAILVKPFSLQMMNYQLIFNEISVFIIYMQAHQFMPKSLINWTDYQNMTRLMVFIIFTIVAVNACFVIFQKMTQIVKCKTVARNRGEQAQIFPTQIPNQLRRQSQVQSQLGWKQFQEPAQPKPSFPQQLQQQQQYNQLLRLNNTTNSQTFRSLFRPIERNQVQVTKQVPGRYPAITISNLINKLKFGAKQAPQTNKNQAQDRRKRDDSESFDDLDSDSEREVELSYYDEEEEEYDDEYSYEDSRSQSNRGRKR